MTIQTASSQTFALVDLDVSAISLPSGLCAASEAVEPYHDAHTRDSRQYRDLVTTYVHTVPPQEGVCVRISMPKRPLSEPLDHRARQEADRKMRSTRLARPVSTTSKKTVTSPRRFMLPRKLINREARRAAEVRESDPASWMVEEPAVTSFDGTTSNDTDPFIKHEHQHPRRIPHTASGLTGRWASQPPTAVAIQADRVNRWDGREPLPPSKPRALSALARGLAIRSVVDACCKNMPPLPDRSRGAKRFLEQWDRSSRVQRERVLKALTDHLLVGDVRCGSISTSQSGLVKGGSLGNDFKWEKENRENQGGRPATVMLVQPPNKMNIHPVSIKLVRDQLPKSHNVASRCRHHEEVTTSAANGVTNKMKKESKVDTVLRTPPGFLKLLGPHAVLLTTRIFSYLQALHACGHEISRCLRVATLLAEATTSSTREGWDDPGCDSLNIVRHLSTPRVIRIALEIIAAKYNAPTGCGAATSSQEEREIDRTQALRLLLAIVCAGGRSVKERLTCSLSNWNVHDWGDAIGPTMVTLCKGTCSVHTRAAAGKLLVELGVGNPAGSTQVWNAVLCLLEQDDDFDRQILGCYVTVNLLARSIPRSSDDDIDSAHDSSSSQCPMRPELMVIPSVLRLGMSSCFGVREAAGDLAVFLTTQQGPCCYLLVSGLVGYLGRISGVDRGGPVSWIPQSLPSSRGSASFLCDGEDPDGIVHLDVESFQDIDDGKPRNGRRQCTDKEDSAVTSVERTRPQADKKEIRRLIGDSFGDKHDDGVRIGLDSKKIYIDLLERLPQAYPHRTNDGDSDYLDHALKLLRRICAGSGIDRVVRDALASTRAPLAILDLIVAPASRGPGPLVDKSKEKLGHPLFEEGKTFVTQTRIENETCGGEQDRQRGNNKERRQDSTKLPLANDTRKELESTDKIWQKSATPAQPSHYCRAVAETLLEMYRRSGGTLLEAHLDGETSASTRRDDLPATLRSDQNYNHEKLPTDSDELKGIIKAAVAGCSHLSHSLRSGDSTGLTFCFSGHGDDIFPADGVKYLAEMDILRKNIRSLTERLGRVLPAPTATVILPTEGKDQPQSFHGSFGGGHIACASEIGEDIGMNGNHNAEESKKIDMVGISGDDWYHDNSGTSALSGGRRSASTVHAIQAKERRVASTPGMQQERREPLNCVLLRTRDRLFSASPPVVHHRGRRRSPHVSAVAGVQKTATGFYEEGQPEGPKVWGPEDWGEGAPTMAILTAPIVRKQKPPVRTEGESPGPIWRTIFGGERDLSSSTIELEDLPNLRTSDITHHGGKSTISNVDRQGPLRFPIESDDTATSSETRVSPVRAADKIDAAKVLKVDSATSATPLRLIEREKNGIRTAKWPPNRFSAARRPTASAVTRKTPTRRRILRVVEDSKGDRDPGAWKRPRNNQTKHNVDVSKVVQSHLKQHADVTSRLGNNIKYHGGLGSCQALEANNDISVIQGSRILRCAFEVAERYATTAIGIK